MGYHLTLINRLFSTTSTTKTTNFIISTLRIDLILKSRSVGSRKLIQDLIHKRRVSDDKGNLILSASSVFPSDAVIYVNNKPIHPVPLLAIFHKPLHVLSTIGDPIGRPNLLQATEKYPYLQNMHPVGRLDSDTSGLLLFSSNGILTNILLQPESCIERVYEAIVTGLVNFDALRAVLLNGVSTTDGTYSATLLDHKHLKYESTMASGFKTEKDFDITLGKLLKDTLPDQPCVSHILLSVTEGKYRMVRRILHNAGHSVVQLKRISYGAATLEDTTLIAGQCCPASTETVQWALTLMKTAERKNSKAVQRNKIFKK